MHPILVVEDDHLLRRLIQDVLEDEGLLVETAADGRQALARGTARRPALVVLDWGLPDATGGEVAEQLRAAHGAALSIILITAGGEAEARAKQMKATSYLPKPFDIEDLLGTVRRLMAQP